MSSFRQYGLKNIPSLKTLTLLQFPSAFQWVHPHFPALLLPCSFVLTTISPFVQKPPETSCLLCKVNTFVFPCFTSSLRKLKFQSPLSATSLFIPLSVYKQAQVSNYRLNKSLPTPSSCLQPSLLPTTTIVQVGNFSGIFFSNKDFGLLAPDEKGLFFLSPSSNGEFLKINKDKEITYCED